MGLLRHAINALLFCIVALSLSSCSSYSQRQEKYMQTERTVPVKQAPSDYAARLPFHINVKERTVMVDPTVHAWGAYDSSGDLIKAGIATAGSDWCPDIGRACHTKPGSFRVASLGTPECKSSLYPRPHGGAPMPYCMFFNGNQGLHGSYQTAEANLSHGCVRLKVADAEWLRYNFVTVGTRVVVKPYY